jgi:hypothetical protein
MTASVTGVDGCPGGWIAVTLTPADLVRLLRAHIKRYGTTPDGRVFQTARGGLP